MDMLMCVAHVYLFCIFLTFRVSAYKEQCFNVRIRCQTLTFSLELSASGCLSADITWFLEGCTGMIRMERSGMCP